MSHTTAITLAASGLTKSYGARQAVADLSISVKPGEIVGILGPNGAGKSTTISMLAGLVTADAGQITLNSAAVNAELSAYKKHIGLVTQDIALFEELSALVNCEIFASLYGAHGQVRNERIREVLAEVGLTARANDKVETYSGGMKRRLNIAVALLHNPDIIMLDEPTVGVDPQSRNAIFDNLETLRRQGKAILYSTHYMEEAEKLCDRVVIIDHGRVVANDTVANLKLMLPASDLVDMELSNLTEQSQREKLIAIGELTSVTEHTARFTVSLKSLSDELPALLIEIAAMAVSITHLSTRRAGLEALFLHLTGRQLRDDDSAATNGSDAPTSSSKKANRSII